MGVLRDQNIQVVLNENEKNLNILVSFFLQDDVLYYINWLYIWYNFI